MNGEPPNKSMGIFGIYKEAFKITSSGKRIFAQITLAILFPATLHLLSSIQLSYFIGYTNKVSFFYAIFNLIFALMSTSAVVYTVACIYTSTDTTYKRVIGVFRTVGARLFVTFLWCFLVWAIYTGVVVGLFLWFFLSVNAEGQGKNKLVLIFGICLLIPFVIGSIYTVNVWGVAMVISVLENDNYGRLALGKSMKLIRGKICFSFAVFLPLYVAIAGLISALMLPLVHGFTSSIVRFLYVTLVCSLLLMVLIHYSLVIQTILYFVCKSHHNEDLSIVAKHLDDGYANLGGEQEDNQLQTDLV
ncbi:hypothetical protein MKX01_005273 [Papaver californicum]|nr:hypothetical protein MKX01_005273 [Papaver californicum]